MYNDLVIMQQFFAREVYRLKNIDNTYINYVW